MNQIKLFLQIEYLGNSGANYLIFASTIVLGLLFKGLISKYLSHTLYKVIGKKEKRVGVERFDELLTKPIAFLYKGNAKYIIDSSSNLIIFKDNISSENLPEIFGNNAENNFIFFLIY